jgi:hypothetical protein
MGKKIRTPVIVAVKRRVTKMIIGTKKDPGLLVYLGLSDLEMAGAPTGVPQA